MWPSTHNFNILPWSHKKSGEPHVFFHAADVQKKTRESHPSRFKEYLIGSAWKKTNGGIPMRQKYLMILASCLLLLHFFKCSFDTRNLRHGTLWIVCSFSCHLYLNIQPYPTDTIRATMLAKASYFTHLGAKPAGNFLPAMFMAEIPWKLQRSIIFWENPWWVSFSCLTTRDLNDTLNETRSFRNPNIFNKSVTMNGDRFTSRMGWQATPWWVFGLKSEASVRGVNVESLSNGLHLEADVKSCNTCGWSFLLRYLKKM